MKTATKKKVTLMLDERVYAGLRARVGERGIGAYLSQLAQPYVITSDIDAGYKAMALDRTNIKETREWLQDHDVLTDKNVWHF